MKRPLFIIIGVVLVLVLVAIWVYVLFFSGSPENGERFANFGFGNTPDSNLPETSPEPEPELPVIDMDAEQERLRQLTTNPTSGFQEVLPTATGTAPYLLYSEAGTGHIYSIDLESGEEQRLSGTTIPQSNRAAFTPNGEHVMMRIGYGENSELVVGSINGTSTDLTNVTVIDRGVLDLTAVIENEFLYSVQTGDSVMVKRYDPITQVATDLFTIPFREATVSWSASAVGTHFVYPKSSNGLPGFVLAAQNGTLTRLPIDGDGLSAIGNEGYGLFSRVVEGVYETQLLNRPTSGYTMVPFVTHPEKCLSSLRNAPLFICADTIVDEQMDMPDAWYRGDISYRDVFWIYQPETNTATLMIDTFTETGRELDVIDPAFDVSEQNLYFVNKIDRTLWTLNRPFATAQGRNVIESNN